MKFKYCESKRAQKYQHYAARFAAKEAIFKAISDALEDKFAISWKDVEIVNDEKGRPQVNMVGAQLKEIEAIDISMSHCKQYATATAVAIYI